MNTGILIVVVVAAVFALFFFFSLFIFVPHFAYRLFFRCPGCFFFIHFFILQAWGTSSFCILCFVFYSSK